MTYYCKRCMIPCEDSVCLACGEEKLWEIQPEDPCFVAVLGVPWAGIFEDVLRQKNIPYLAKPLWGAAWSTTLGNKFEKFRFLVPYDRLETAKELARQLFFQENEDGTMNDSLLE